MISKIITPHLYADEPTTTLWAPGASLQKTAYANNDELKAYLSQLHPEPDVSYVLVNAMGAYESFGPNSNLDAFEEHELLPNYKSFEQAHVFTNHANRDSSKARGTIPKAMWNKVMKRVELVLRLPHLLNLEILTKLEGGTHFGVSMGTRVKYDRCSVCGNQAPTRLQYCEHLLTQLGHVYPDGLVTFMYNHDPQFFDLSVVERPADKTGWAMAKVASGRTTPVELWSRLYADPTFLATGHPAEGAMMKSASQLPPSVAAAEMSTVDEKYATVRKLADIDKEIPDGEIMGYGELPDLYAKFYKEHLPALRASEPDDHALVDHVAHHDIMSALATLAVHGVFLKPSEFMRLSMLQAPHGNARGEADALHAAGIHPGLVEPQESPFPFDVRERPIDHAFADKVASSLLAKSYHRGALLTRLGDQLPHVKQSSVIAVPADMIEPLARMGGVFEAYISSATKLAATYNLARDGQSKVAKQLTLTDGSSISTIGGLPAVIFGEHPAKVASEMKARLRGMFDYAASVKLASRYFDAGGPAAGAPPLMIDLQLMKLAQDPSATQ